MFYLWSTASDAMTVASPLFDQYTIKHEKQSPIHVCNYDDIFEITQKQSSPFIESQKNNPEVLKQIELLISNRRFPKALENIDYALEEAPSFTLLIKKMYCLNSIDSNSKDLVRSIALSIINATRGNREKHGWAISWSYYFLAKTEQCLKCQIDLIEAIYWINDPLPNIFAARLCYDLVASRSHKQDLLNALETFKSHRYSRPKILPLSHIESPQWTPSTSPRPEDAPPPYSRQQKKFQHRVIINDGIEDFNLRYGKNYLNYHNSPKKNKHNKTHKRS